jgi:hypothetical protein
MEPKERVMRTKLASWLWIVAACTDSAAGSGELSVALEAEDTIADGIAAGDDVEDVRDGWSVSYGKYVVTVGDVQLSYASERSERAEAPELFAVDLKKVPEAGLQLWQLEGLRPGRWEFGWAMLPAADGVERDESVTEDDFARLRDDGLTHLIEGRLDKSDGRSCPPGKLARPGADATAAGENERGESCYENPTIEFTLDAVAAVAYSLCEIDGVSGVSVPSGGSQAVALTIHGDHLFFNGFPSGSEGGISRLAQWFADADLNVDGAITREELDSIPLSDLAEVDERFQLGGSPLELDSAASTWTYVRAQLQTQGHLQGEGECQLGDRSEESQR